MPSIYYNPNPCNQYLADCMPNGKFKKKRKYVSFIGEYH